MNDILTKAAARNIFYGGTIFFFLQTVRKVTRNGF
jgi:hypothetical protein